jgi:hypothetical protein
MQPLSAKTLKRLVAASQAWLTPLSSPQRRHIGSLVAALAFPPLATLRLSLAVVPPMLPLLPQEAREDLRPP